MYAVHLCTCMLVISDAVRCSAGCWALLANLCGTVQHCMNVCSAVFIGRLQLGWTLSEGVRTGSMQQPVQRLRAQSLTFECCIAYMHCSHAALHLPLNSCNCHMCGNIHGCLRQVDSIDHHYTIAFTHSASIAGRSGQSAWQQQHAKLSAVPTAAVHHALCE